MDLLIETPRLIIRPLEPKDAQGMFEMDSDPEVHKYVGKKPISTLQQAEDVIEFIRQQYIDNGVGRWAVIEKYTNDFVGWTGHKLMKTEVNGHIDFIDFGYRLTRKHWGKGYATESGRAALHYGIEQLHFKDVYAMTDIDNRASRNVLEKLGFRLQEVFNYDAEPTWRNVGEPTTWYKWMR